MGSSQLERVWSDSASLYRSMSRRCNPLHLATKSISYPSVPSLPAPSTVLRKDAGQLLESFSRIFEVLYRANVKKRFVKHRSRNTHAGRTTCGNRKSSIHRIEQGSKDDPGNASNNVGQADTRRPAKIQTRYGLLLIHLVMTQTKVGLSSGAQGPAIWSSKRSGSS